MKHRIIKSVWRILLLMLYISHTQLFTIDNPHFWKAPRYYGFPTTAWWDHNERYDTLDWRTSIDVSYGHGSTHSGWDTCGNKTSVLNINGPSNMPFLLTNVPSPCPTNFIETIGRTLNQSQVCGNFGKLEFCGKFTLDEVDIDIRQNLKCGFFLQAYLPIRWVAFKCINYCDLSPTEGRFSQNTPDWIRFKNFMPQLFLGHCMRSPCTEYSKFAAGDLSFLVGWQHLETENLCALKYLGSAIRLGVLFPTGTEDNPCYAFSVPTGYNNHWGLPVHAEINFGIADWLEATIRGGAIFFAKKTLTRQMKTTYNQGGFFKIARGDAEEKKGTHWYVGGDIKFDHFWHGFSFLFAYSFNRGEHDTLCPKQKCCVIVCQGCCDATACPPTSAGSSCSSCTSACGTSGSCCNFCNDVAQETCAFDRKIVNSDCVLRPWQMHVVHFMLDYDFSVHMQNARWAPRLNIFYNLPVAGRHAFATDLYGAGVGLDIRW